MQKDDDFFAPVREIEVLGAGAERASTCVDALSHRPPRRSESDVMQSIYSRIARFLTKFV